MSKNKRDLTEYMIVLSQYFLLISDEQNSPKIIQELNEKLNRILNEIHEKLKLDKFQKSDCKEFTVRIDEIILLTAELGLQSKVENRKYLSLIKEKLWYLLENLESYCIESYDITIW